MRLTYHYSNRREYLKALEWDGYLWTSRLTYLQHIAGRKGRD